MGTWWRVDKLTRTVRPAKSVSNNRRFEFFRSFEEAKDAAIDMVRTELSVAMERVEDLENEWASLERLTEEKALAMAKEES